MNKLSVDINTLFPQSPFVSTGGSGEQIPRLITFGLTISISIAGLILLFLIIGAGYKIISGSGKGNSDEVSKGVKALGTSIVGFLVVVFAYFILRLVEMVFFQSNTPFTKPGF